jgi:predicted O-methyltransferase YrrM
MPVTAIRPHQLFERFKSIGDARLVQSAIPAHHGPGGLHTLEARVLIAALRIVEATRVFEFGTFLGATTLNLAANPPDDGTVFTLDPGEAAITAEGEDRQLAAVHLHARMDFEGSALARKIKPLVGNSRTFDFAPWRGSINLVFYAKFASSEAG